MSRMNVDRQSQYRTGTAQSGGGVKQPQQPMANQAMYQNVSRPPLASAANSAPQSSLTTVQPRTPSPLSQFMGSPLQNNSPTPVSPGFRYMQGVGPLDRSGWSTGNFNFSRTGRPAKVGDLSSPPESPFEKGYSPLGINTRLLSDEDAAVDVLQNPIQTQWKNRGNITSAKNYQGRTAYDNAWADRVNAMGSEQLDALLAPQTQAWRARQSPANAVKSYNAYKPGSIGVTAGAPVPMIDPQNHSAFYQYGAKEGQSLIPFPSVKPSPAIEAAQRVDEWNQTRDDIKFGEILFNAMYPNAPSNQPQQPVQNNSPTPVSPGFRYMQGVGPLDRSGWSTGYFNFSRTGRPAKVGDLSTPPESPFEKGYSPLGINTGLLLDEHSMSQKPQAIRAQELIKSLAGRGSSRKFSPPYVDTTSNDPWVNAANKATNEQIDRRMKPYMDTMTSSDALFGVRNGSIAVAPGQSYLASDDALAEFNAEANGPISQSPTGATAGVPVDRRSPVWQQQYAQTFGDAMKADEQRQIDYANQRVDSRLAASDRLGRTMGGADYRAAGRAGVIPLRGMGALPSDEAIMARQNQPLGDGGPAAAAARADQLRRREDFENLNGGPSADGLTRYMPNSDLLSFANAYRQQEDRQKFEALKNAGLARDMPDGYDRNPNERPQLSGMTPSEIQYYRHKMNMLTNPQYADRVNQQRADRKEMLDNRREMARARRQGALEAAGASQQLRNLMAGRGALAGQDGFNALMSMAGAQNANQAFKDYGQAYGAQTAPGMQAEYLEAGKDMLDARAEIERRRQFQDMQNQIITSGKPREEMDRSLDRLREFMLADGSGVPGQSGRESDGIPNWVAIPISSDKPTIDQYRDWREAVTAMPEWNQLTPEQQEAIDLNIRNQYFRGLTNADIELERQQSDPNWFNRNIFYPTMRLFGVDPASEEQRRSMGRIFGTRQPAVRNPPNTLPPSQPPRNVQPDAPRYDTVF